MTDRRKRIKEQLEKNPFLPVNLAVANVLREDILACRVEPNGRLKEGPLSEDMDVSRTTVRRAFEILMSEELVIKNETQGVRVAGFNDDLERQLSDYRILIDPMLTKVAAMRRTDQDLQEIESKLKALEAADDSKCYMEIDISFHEAIYRATHNTFLISAAQIYLDGVYRRKIYWSGDVFGRYKRNIHREHVQIYQALVRRDPKMAYEEARKHSGQNYIQRVVREAGLPPDND